MCGIRGGSRGGLLTILTVSPGSVVLSRMYFAKVVNDEVDDSAKRRNSPSPQCDFQESSQRVRAGGFCQDISRAEPI